MRKIIVFGTFDILHKGHLNLFKQAKQHGDYLMAVIARDKNVKKAKGKFPKNKERIRLKKVKPHVNKAFLGYIKDQYKIIKKTKPDLICLGYDQKADIKQLRQLKIQIKRLKSYYPHKYKSSKLQ